MDAGAERAGNAAAIARRLGTGAIQSIQRFEDAVLEGRQADACRASLDLLAQAKAMGDLALRLSEKAGEWTSS